MQALPVENINVSHIDFTDNRYKISKPEISDQLMRSIKTHGLLEFPVLLPQYEKYIVVGGHNRLVAAKNTGASTVPCRIMDPFDMGTFLGHAVLKIDRGEVGPIGRLKLYNLLKKTKTEAIQNDRLFARRELGIPDFLLGDEAAIETILSIPDTIAFYADSRDVHYRVLREIGGMSSAAVSLLSSWLDQIPMRVNIFREVVEMLSEISRRDGSIETASAIKIPDIRDPRGRENSLHSSLMSLRCPRYTVLKEEADNLIAKLRAVGIEVTFPNYFEGDTIGLTVKVSKKDGPAVVRDTFTRADEETLGKLLDLL